MDYSPFKSQTDGGAPRGHRAHFALPLPASRAEPSTSPVRVLLVHRPGIFRQGLAGLLTAAPDVVLLAQAADGEAAWEAIRTHVPHLALLDLALAKPSGIEIARRVQAAALPTRCLMLATDTDNGLAAEALCAGAAGCFLTDGGFADLLSALRSIAAGGTYLSPSLAVRPHNLPGAGHDALSPRELEVVRLLAAGQSSKVIARTLDISPLTVDTHRRRLMRKLDMHSVAEVVRWALRSGLVV